MLDAEIKPAGPGSSLIGAIRFARSLAVFTSMWLFFVVAFLCFGLGLAVDRVFVRGNYLHGAGQSLPFVLIPALMLVFGLYFCSYGVQHSHADREWLSNWLEGQLTDAPSTQPAAGSSNESGQ